MSTARNLDSVISALSELNVMLERLRGEFVHGLKTPADYERACDVLDELTDGRELAEVEEKILADLEDAMLAYQRDSEQFKASNAAFEATCTPVQLLKDLMDMHGLSNSDIPEIGDKFSVSRVLNGRPMSHKMAYALAERFATEPKAFLSVQVETKKDAPKTIAKTWGKLARHQVLNSSGGFIERSASGSVLTQSRRGELIEKRVSSGALTQTPPKPSPSDRPSQSTVKAPAKG